MKRARVLASVLVLAPACIFGDGSNGTSATGGSPTSEPGTSSTHADTGAPTEGSSTDAGGSGGGSGGSGSGAGSGGSTGSGGSGGSSGSGGSGGSGGSTSSDGATSSGADTGLGSDASTSTGDPTGGATTDATTGDTGDTGDTGGDPNDNTTPAGVCARWKQDRADLDNGPWSGDLAACDAGDTAPQGRANALKLINMYRWLADLPPVTHDPTRDAKAQACALLMHANGKLSHSPPMSWKCWTSEGAEGAGKSNIATTPGVQAVDVYMADPGNPTTLGHRRWILANTLGPVGLGSTSAYSCMWVLGGSGKGLNEWTAWPAPGPFPLQAFKASWQSIDQTGWSIQTSVQSLAGAQVKVTADGQDKPVKVTQLNPGYGSTAAISIIPQGWTSQAGVTYIVEVTGIAQPINYKVEVVDCK